VTDETLESPALEPLEVLRKRGEKPSIPGKDAEQRQHDRGKLTAENA
jgi:hypothetical protein